jgi:hypothetical protein
MMVCEPISCSLVEDEQKEERIVTVFTLSTQLPLSMMPLTFTQTMARVVDLFLHQQRMLPAGTQRAQMRALLRVRTQLLCTQTT